MGGQAEAISSSLRASHREGLQLGEAIRVALRSLEAGHQQGGQGTESLRTDQLEVAVLDRNRPRRAFRRIAGAALERLLREASRGGPGEAAGKTTAASDTAASDTVEPASAGDAADDSPEGEGGGRRPSAG